MYFNSKWSSRKSFTILWQICLGAFQRYLWRKKVSNEKLELILKIYIFHFVDFDILLGVYELMYNRTILGEFLRTNVVTDDVTLEQISTQRII